jgi:hypothetical protein
MIDSSTLVWLFVLVTLLPGSFLLIGHRISVNARSGLLLACSGAGLALACLIATSAIAYNWSLLLS